jgi:hypothetical protein
MNSFKTTVVAAFVAVSLNVALADQPVHCKSIYLLSQKNNSTYFRFKRRGFRQMDLQSIVSNGSGFIQHRYNLYA